MRKIVFLLLTCSICLLLMGCDIFFQINEHSCIYSDWETVEEATCLAQGEEERYCIICYDVESRAIDKTDHTSVDVKEKSPTCTQEGSTKGSYCSECLIILSGIEKISPTGHTEVIDPAIDATDDAPGRTEGKHCSTCGEVLVKQMSIF